jgi:PAS domain S-box-containing protein
MKQLLRILHLEDNKQDAELIHEKLAAEGIECGVTLVDTREGFVSAIERAGFDIILADYKLPSFDGISALKIANEKCPDIPFIFISGTIGEDTAVEALKSGATDYIIKDRLSRLAPAVRRAVKEAEERIERKRAEESLRHSEARYRSLFENMIEGFAYCRMIFEDNRPQDFIYLDVNDAFGKLTGLENVVGKKVTEVIPGIRESDPGLFEIYGRVALTGKPESFETFVKALKMWFSISVYSPGKEYFVAVFDVITERKQAEEELVRLYQQNKEEAEISASLLTLVETLNTSLDERELIKNVVTLVPRYLKFDRIGIFLYDESLWGFVFSGGHGFSPAEESILLSRNFRAGDFPAMDKAVRGETLVIENAPENDLISKELVDTFGVKGAVIVPISARGKVIGGIYGDNKTMRSIEKKDVSFLKGLADGIAIALQNSRLYRESVERMMELSGKIETIKAMALLDREILSTIDRSAILKTAVTLVSRIIPCERAAVLLLEGENYKVISEWGAGRFLDNVYGLENSHFALLETKRSSLFIPDLAGDSSDCLYHKGQHAIGIKSCLLVPLVTKGEMIGLLDIGSTFHGRLTPTHLSTAENIGSQITVALENARLYEELQQLLVSTITSLASAIDAKSPWTKGHSERVTQYALQIGTEMGLKDEELDRLKLSGLFHDVGKIGTYDILLDKPTKLTDEEFELVKKHPLKGVEILSPIRQLTDIIPGVRHHHERYDGKGYPDGFKGEEIPLQARILCVADSFDSMTADRPYRPSPGKEYAISEFRRCSGTHFDPKVIKAFLRVLQAPEYSG